MKTWMRNLLVIICGINGMYTYAQTYNMNFWNDGATFTTCSGVFRDGPGNYANNIYNRTITFCPATPNTYLRLSFTEFQTEYFYDTLEVFYGPNATGTADAYLSGYVGPFTITSPNVGECITFRFNTDFNIRESGWIANISCVAPCSPPVAVFNGPSETNICDTAPNHTVTFDASASYSTDAFPITEYIWHWGDGTPSTTTTTPTTSHTFPNDYGIYNVQLRVKNNNTFYEYGCYSTNNAFHTVRVLPPPDFAGTDTGPLQVNCGETVDVTGIAASQTIIGDGRVINSESLILPDGLNAAYVSSINMNGLFPPGAVVDANCLPQINLDLEHSYAGDLIISLIAPSGQQVILFNGNALNSGYTMIGYCANELDNQVPGCTAPYHIVNTGGILWTDPAAEHTNTQTCAEYAGPCEVADYFVPNQNYNSFEPLTGLIGSQLNGNWQLRILDIAGLDDGFLKSWSMTFPNQCYADIEIVTPILSGGLWSPVGSAPPINGTQTVNDTPHTTTGIDPCPPGETCIGNQLSNTTTLGPFEAGSIFDYIFTVTDDYGCTYTQSITIEVQQQSAQFDNMTLEYCEDETAQNLDTTSSNGFDGTWSPTSIDTSQTGQTTYTFTPDATCADPYDININVTPKPITTEIDPN